MKWGHFARGACICILSGYIPAAHGVFETTEDTQTISKESSYGMRCYTAIRVMVEERSLQL
jgi:hypothetical protein